MKTRQEILSSNLLFNFIQFYSSNLLFSFTWEAEMYSF